LWIMLMFELWHRNFLENIQPADLASIPMAADCR
jgi:hypothetical protein